MDEALSLFNKAKGFLENATSTVGDWLAQRANDVSTAVSHAASAVGDWISDRASDVGAWINGAKATVQGNLAIMAGDATKASLSAMTTLQKGLLDMGQPGLGAMTTNADIINAATQPYIDNLGRTVSDININISSQLGSMVNATGVWIADLGNSIMRGITEGISNLGKWIGEAWNNVTTWIGDKLAEVGAFIGKAWSWLIEQGVGAIQALVALPEMIGKIVYAMTHFLDVEPEKFIGDVQAWLDMADKIKSAMKMTPGA